MGASISRIHSHFEFQHGTPLPETPRQVVALAGKSLQPLIERGLPADLSHLIVATTCPDMLAPSLGQMLNEVYHPNFENCQVIDIVQGCTGGVTSMVLGSQLCEHSKASVLVIQADAARKAVSRTSPLYDQFGNGSFACLLQYDFSEKKMLHHGSRQYCGLSEVVTVNLGHDADALILREQIDMRHDPRRHLGLSMNNLLAVKLLRHAEEFYLDFVKASGHPDVMILHQANPQIVKHLKDIFIKYPVRFIDVSARTGNCGAATVGIALSQVEEELKGRKIMLCSYGTGGVITAGLWQN